MLETLRSRDDVFRFLDNYTSERADEIEGRQTRKPLLKSFIFETSARGNDASLLESTMSEFGNLNHLDGNVFHLHNPEKNIEGIIEPLLDRYLILYSLDHSDIATRFAGQLVNGLSELDHLWLSGFLFDLLWGWVQESHEGHRFTKMRFSFQSQFDDVVSEESDEDHGSNRERKGSSISLTDRLDVIAEVLPHFRKLGNVMPAFEVADLLRLPSMTGSGGHDFYFDGKVTDRSSSFLDHRSQILDVTRFYSRLTREIEKRVWMEVETVHVFPGRESVTLHGAPVHLMFREPLSLELFQTFIFETFEKNRGPFRLWGNPIRLGPGRVHVYGVDLHLWQEIYMELTRESFLVVLPNGTCGNTVHRLITNVQHFLDPRVNVFIGGTPLDDIMRMVDSEDFT